MSKICYFSFGSTSVRRVKIEKKNERSPSTGIRKDSDGGFEKKLMIWEKQGIGVEVEVEKKGKQVFPQV